MAHFFLEVCYSESILKAGAAVARVPRKGAWRRR